MADQKDLALSERNGALAEVNTGSTSAVSLIEALIDKSKGGADLEAVAKAIESLVNLKHQEEDREAERAFNRALAEFQSECPPIPKNKKAGGITKAGKKFETPYADLDTIRDTIQDLMSAKGLSFNFSQETLHDGGKKSIKSTCELRHTQGYSIRRSATVEVDTSAYMNISQKDGSAGTYADRYALIAALGLVHCKIDTDATDPAQLKTISEEQQATIRALLDEIKPDMPKFWKFVNVTKLSDIVVGDYGRVIDALERKRAKQ